MSDSGQEARDAMANVREGMGVIRTVEYGPIRPIGDVTQMSIDYAQAQDTITRLAAECAYHKEHIARLDSVITINEESYEEMYSQRATARADAAGLRTASKDFIDAYENMDVGYHESSMSSVENPESDVACEALRSALAASEKGVE